MGGVGPSSLPPTLNRSTKPDYGKSTLFNKDLERSQLPRSISTEDTSQIVGIGLPPKGTLGSNSACATGNGYARKIGGSPLFPRKSLLTKKNSDPCGISENCGSSGIFSERLSQFQRRSSGANFDESLPAAPAAGYSVGKRCGDKNSFGQQNNVMQQVRHKNITPQVISYYVQCVTFNAVIVN